MQKIINEFKGEQGYSNSLDSIPDLRRHIKSEDIGKY